MSADGKEVIGAQITIQPDGHTEVRSREAAEGPLKGAAPKDSSVAPAAAEAEVGTLHTGCHDLNLTLAGEGGCRPRPARRRGWLRASPDPAYKDLR
ncbi:MAG: hypothetical protein FJ280_11885 [Planctomycetes bacterium]|nr:hypothetical protein [Planctomycetota bacterium]MBM4026089.1 hypothetical protein [Planctomycetota bacterium]